MKKKIYIITSGEYSDYHICAVFTTREKADDYVQQKGLGYRIEEHDLDKEVIKNTQLWCVEFNLRYNEVVNAKVRDYDEDEVRDTCHVERFISGDYMYLYVDADSMDRAIKIASERLVAIKANEYIWLRLTRPYEIDRYGIKKYESFNVKTNEFTKDQEL
jgi:hypothetical protein